MNNSAVLVVRHIMILVSFVSLALLRMLRDPDNESVSLELGDAVAVSVVTPAHSVAPACTVCRASENWGSGLPPRCTSALCENTLAEFRIRVTLPRTITHTHHCLFLFSQHLSSSSFRLAVSPSVCRSQVPQARCSEEIQAQNGSH